VSVDEIGRTESLVRDLEEQLASARRRLEALKE
jgi:hypothetical protein